MGQDAGVDDGRLDRAIRPGGGDDREVAVLSADALETGQIHLSTIPRPALVSHCRSEPAVWILVIVGVSEQGTVPAERWPHQPGQEKRWADEALGIKGRAKSPAA